MGEELNGMGLKGMGEGGEGERPAKHAKGREKGGDGWIAGGGLRPGSG